MEILFKSMIINIQILLTIISFYFSKKIHGKIIAPTSLYCVINTFTILLVLLNLLPYFPINNIPLLLILISEFCLIFGSLFGIALYNSYNKSKMKKKERKFNNVKVVQLSLRIIGLISTFGWVFAFIKIMLSQFSISFLLNNPHYIGNIGITAQYIGYLNLLGIWVLPMFVYCFVMGNSRKIDILFVASSFVGLFLAGIKIYIVISLVTSLFVYIILTQKIKVRYLFITGILGLLFFVFYNLYIDPWSGKVTFIGSKFPESLRFLEQPYRYVTGPLMGFSELSYYSGDIFPYKGYVAFSWFFKLLAFFNLFDGEVATYLKSTNIGENGIGINVYTLVGELFLDIGLLGMILYMFIFGVIISILFEVAKNSENIISIFLSSLLLFVIFFSFFAFYLNFNTLVLIVGCVLIINISKKIVGGST